ncbi:MAG TPA: hypothetical protein VFS43_31515 [Polyangiaceae bacterium]|nr:hypothetical protein [Polyangiaceae bacterium]
MPVDDGALAPPRPVGPVRADLGASPRGARPCAPRRTRSASYAERLASPDLEAFVRRLAYERHRPAFVALRGGEFDEALERTMLRPDRRPSGVARRAGVALPEAISTSPPAAGPRLPSTAPRSRAARAAPTLPSLRALEGYRASGVVDLASGKLLASDGLVGAAALVASLRELLAGYDRALAALAVEDGAGDYTLLGASSCMLLRPLPSRPGAYLYLVCDQAPAELGALRATLAAAVAEIA